MLLDSSHDLAIGEVSFFYISMLLYGNLYLLINGRLLQLV